MNGDTMTIENRRREELLAARREAENGEETAGENAPAAAGRHSKASRAPHWLLAFIAVGFVWLIGLVLDLIIPFITFIVNFLTVLALWMWAKSSGLNPPTFAAAAKIAGGGGGQAAGKIAASLPGSDLLYILSSGAISPIIYLAALWWNNR